MITTHLKWCTRQSCPVLIYLLQKLASPILTVVPLWYFLCCFSLAFLEGHCISSSPVAISLHLDPVTQNLLAPSNKAASFASTLSWSHWRYSNIFFFFSSTILCLLASSLLQLMPLGCSMEKGKGYDNMISYTIVVSVSISCSRCYNLALF